MRIRKNRQHDTVATVITVVVHLVVGALLFFNLAGGSSTPSPPTVEVSTGEALDAVAMDEARLESELQRLADERQAVREAEEQRQAALEQAAREAEQTRRREEARADALARQQAESTRRLEQQTRAEEQRLEELRQQRATAERERVQEQERLERLKREAEEAERARRAAEERRRQDAARKAAEEERRQQELARQAEEARRQEAARQAAEEARRREQELARQAAEEGRRQEEARRRAEAQRLAAAREDAIRDMVGQHGIRVRRHIERNWLLPPGSPRDLIAILSITLAPDGQVSRVDVTRSSGDSNFDRFAVAAVQRASPLPMPDDPEVAAKFRAFNFRFNPGG